MDNAPRPIGPVYNILGGSAHNKNWNSQILGTTYMEYDKTLIQIVNIT
jgi:hypothetical protein